MKKLRITAALAALAVAGILITAPSPCTAGPIFGMIDASAVEGWVPKLPQPDEPVPWEQIELFSTLVPPVAIPGDVPLWWDAPVNDASVGDPTEPKEGTLIGY